ncbi:8703_t:CDS:2, partial [Dentiscutata erythropus]
MAIPVAMIQASTKPMTTVKAALKKAHYLKNKIIESKKKKPQKLIVIKSCKKLSE